MNRLFTAPQHPFDDYNLRHNTKDLSPLKNPFTITTSPLTFGQLSRPSSRPSSRPASYKNCLFRNEVEKSKIKQELNLTQNPYCLVTSSPHLAPKSPNKILNFKPPMSSMNRPRSPLREITPSVGNQRQEPSTRVTSRDDKFRITFSSLTRAKAQPLQVSVSKPALNFKQQIVSVPQNEDAKPASKNPSTHTLKSQPSTCPTSSSSSSMCDSQLDQVNMSVSDSLALDMNPFLI